MHRDDFPRYLRWFTACTALLCATSAVFVAVMDPYRIFGTPTIEGLNEIKPYPDRFQSEIKLSMALRGAGNVLILGNSRAEIGFDPEHEVFSGRRAFNLAVPGAGIETSYAQLEKFIATRGAPERMVIGLDLIDFLVREASGPPEEPRRTVGPAEELRWRFEGSFSLGALRDSLATIGLQRDPYAPQLTARGLNPLNEYPRIAQESGYFPLFRQRAQESAKLYARLPKAVRNARGSSSAIELLREILKVCRQHNIQTDLIIYPLHAQMLLIMEQAGLGETMQQWKALLVQELEKYAPPEKGVRVKLWDFSGFGGARCESIPSEGDRTTMTQWYWEAGHFKRSLGDVVLRTVVGGEQSNAAVLTGVVLDSTSLADNEARIESERRSCFTIQPSLDIEARRIVEAATAR